jgi:flavin reductase (DIM6/NTAB) family NADH-FMN oxidoreductase RutF
MLFDFSKITPHERHKLMISVVVPRPIAWVVTEDEVGQINVAPFSFFNVVSDEPPLVVLGIGNDERGNEPAKDSGRNIRLHKEFVVNLVSKDLAAAMVMTGVNFAPSVNELERAGLTAVPAALVKPPRIAESPAGLECRLYQTIDLPSGRMIFLGEVVAIHIDEQAMLDVEKYYVDTPKLDLIGRMHGAGWYSTTVDRFQMRTPHEAASRAPTDKSERTTEPSEFADH